MTLYEIKQNDTRPRPDALLRFSDGTIPNLTGATVKFIAREVTSAEAKIDAAATITDVPTGAVEYTLLAADTDLTGTYYCEWEVTFADSSVQTFPTRGFDRLRIRGDLA